MEKGAILGEFCSTLVSPGWLRASESNQSWCVSLMLIGDYYSGVRKFWLSFIWSLRTETHFLAQNQAQLMQRQRSCCTNQTTNAF